MLAMSALVMLTTSVSRGQGGDDAYRPIDGGIVGGIEFNTDLFARQYVIASARMPIVDGSSLGHSPLVCGM